MDVGVYLVLLNSLEGIALLKFDSQKLGFCEITNLLSFQNVSLKLAGELCTFEIWVCYVLGVHYFEVRHMALVSWIFYQKFAQILVRVEVIRIS